VRLAGKRLAWVLAGTLLVTAVGAVTVWSEVTTVAPRAAITDLVGLFRAPSPTPGSLAWKVEHNQRIDILFLARGGAGNDNPNFTDTILVLSIRPATGQATLVTLPRFLWADMPALVNGGISGKLYSAFALGMERDNPSLRSQWRTATGSGDLAAATVAGVIGESIDAWVAGDINSFRAIVDALGGIRVTVPTPLDDPGYPVADTGMTVRVHFDAGSQTMDGERALEYARSRLSTSEADRSNRQELIMTAILDRIRTLKVGPALLPLLGAVRQGMLTNLDLTEMRQLDQLLGHVRPAGISRVSIDETNVLQRQTLPDGDYILVPRGGTFTEVQQYVQAALP
jgi:LCP family protein required for cell wall assembly